MTNYYKMGVELSEPLFDAQLAYYRQGRDTVITGARDLRIAGRITGLVSNQAYQQGLNTDRVGALVATPGYIRDQVNALGSEISAYDHSIAVQAGLPGIGGTPNQALTDWWRANWSPFMTEWSAFRVKHNGEGGSIYIENFWGNTWDTTQEYRKRFIALKEAAESVGFGFNTLPEIRPPDTGILEQVGSGIWGLVKIVIMAGIAVIVVISVMRKIG